MVLSQKELQNIKLKNFKRLPKLSIEGDSDNNGFQIFTPDFVVLDMLNSIGMENIIDINKTILEPASGDGAFTVRILQIRLENIIKKSKGSFLLDSAKAISTIYSIEMDQKLLIEQRNNVFSLINYFLSKYSIKFTIGYLELIEDIIKTNFIWGETNIREDKFFKDNNESIIGWYMPTEVESIELKYIEKEVEATNLFGEKTMRKIKSNKKKPQKVIKDKRIRKNRIKIYKWSINEDLSYSKEIVPIEVD